MEKKLDAICRKIIQKRDLNKPCIICDLPMHEHQLLEVAHYFKRRHIGTRWQLSNLHLSHSACNRLEESQKSYSDKHTINMLDREGINVFEQLKNLRLKELKLSDYDKKNLLQELQKILKTMCIIFFLTLPIWSCTRIIGQNTPKIWIVDKCTSDTTIDAHTKDNGLYVYNLPCYINVEKGDTIKVVDFGRKIYIRITSEEITNYNKLPRP
jgi:hypothetical protein